PAKLAGDLYADLDDEDDDAGPTDDPSSMHHVANKAPERHEPDEPDEPEDNGLGGDNPSSMHDLSNDSDDDT
ncbi:MAG TPA: hypothetical protein VGM39_17720, partial [Kofleriaceae bacterium]